MAPADQPVGFDRLLAQLCRQIVEGLGANSCSLSEWDRARGTVMTWVTYVPDPERGRALQIEPGQEYPLRDYPATARVLEERVPVTIRLDDPESDAFERSLLEQAGDQALLMLPLIAGDAVIGLLEVFQHDRRRPFTEDEISVAWELAGRAAEAIKGSHLFVQSRREAHDLTALLEAGAAIMSSLELESVLRAVVEQMARLTGVDECILFLWDEGTRSLQTWAEYSGGDSQVSTADRPGVVFPVAEFALIARVLEDRIPVAVRIPDPGVGPAEHAFLNRFELQSLLIVPVVAHERVIGLLELRGQPRQQLDDRDVALAESLTGQAAIAIDNARLLEDHGRQITQLAIVNEIGHALSSRLELGDLLLTVHQQVSRVFDTTNFYITLYEEQTDEWVTVFHLEHGEAQPPARSDAGLGLTGQIIRTGQPILLRNPEEYTAFHQQHGIEFLGERATSWLGVPLIASDRLLGVMVIQSYSSPNLYSEQDLALFSTIAGQVASALDNQRLVHESRRRAQQMEAINEVGQALSSVLDLDVLLRQIVDITKNRFGHYFVSIALLEGDKLTFRGSSMIGESGERMDLADLLLDLQGIGLVAETARTRQPVLVDDVTADRRYLAVAELAGTRSELTVPIMFQDQVVGVLDVQSDRARAYDQADVMLLQALAGQAGVAIQNARLFQKSERRVAEMTTLNEIGQRLAAVRDLDQVTRAIYEQVGRVFDTTNFYVALYEEERREWETVLDIVGGEAQPSVRGSVGEGLTGYIIRNRRPLLFFNGEEVDRFHREQAIGEIGEAAQSWLGVPMVAGERVVGAIAVESYEEEHLYTEDDLSVLSTVASQAAVAIENARFYQESLRRAQDLSALIQVGTTLVSTLDLRVVLEAVCREALNLLHATSAYVVEFDRESQRSVVVAESYGLDATDAERVSDVGHFYVEDDFVVNLLEQGQPHLARIADPNTTPYEKQSLVQYDGKSSLMLPLIARGNALGYIEIWESRYDRIFAREEILLGQNLASQAAIAIENAHLYDQVQHQLAELRQASEVQAELLQQVREMSTPVIPVHDRVLVLPLIGVLDSERARQFTERLLEAVRQQRARVVLLDITGVPLVDTAVARSLLNAADAARLLGADVVLVGVRSEVAHTLVSMGMSMEGLVTKANLQAGIVYALSRLGREIVDKEASGMLPARR